MVSLCFQLPSYRYNYSHETPRPEDRMLKTGSQGFMNVRQTLSIDAVPYPGTTHLWGVGSEQYDLWKCLMATNSGNPSHPCSTAQRDQLLLTFTALYRMVHRAIKHTGEDTGKQGSSR